MTSSELPALGIGKTPQPPYYAVIFTSQRNAGDDGYGAMAERMEELARRQPGFLAMDSVRGPDGIGITVGYWRDETSIRSWKQHVEHLHAQQQGRERWYRSYQIRVARVERAYGFEAQTRG
jgi:heme-degrading monooxygenase HmoA